MWVLPISLGMTIVFFEENEKRNLQNLNRARAEEAGTSAAGALVSNPENKRGVIKAFIVSSRFFPGT